MTTTTTLITIVALAAIITTDPCAVLPGAPRQVFRREDRLAQAEARKRARITYKEAKDKLASLRRAIRKSKDATDKEALQRKADLLAPKVEAFRKEWKQLVARDKAARVSRKDRKRGPCAGDVPTPVGFEIVKRARDFYRQVIDRTWKPPPSQCTALGKYVFHTFHEEAIMDVEAFIRIRVPGNGVSDQELATLVSDYFYRDECKVYWGQVRILSIERDTRPYHRDCATIRISTDHRRIRGMIKPSDQVYQGPYKRRVRGGGAPAANQGSRATAKATTTDSVPQDVATVNGGE